MVCVGTDSGQAKKGSPTTRTMNTRIKAHSTCAGRMRYEGLTGSRLGKLDGRHWVDLRPSLLLPHEAGGPRVDDGHVRIATYAVPLRVG